MSGSRTLADLRDTPNSTSVLNRELLDDLIATKISEAMFFSENLPTPETDAFLLKSSLKQSLA